MLVLGGIAWLQWSRPYGSYIAAIAALGAEFTGDAPEGITDRVRDLGRRLAS